MSTTFARLREILAATSSLIIGLVVLVPPPTHAAVLSPRILAPTVDAEPAMPLTAPTTVTLITGDSVTLLPSPTGRTEVVLDASRGGRSDYAIRRDGERIEVIPHDVLDLVPAVLDPDLFDVAGLAAMGYDDAHTDSIPLIVHRAPGRPVRLIDRAFDHAGDLSSIASAAVRLDKQGTDRFGAVLASLAAHPRAATRSTRADLLGGIDRIWLDARVEAAAAPVLEGARTTSEPAAADLDPYLSQVGAPDAWAAGLDGSGVSVAILDSGIDRGHSALAGRVRSEQNFTDADSARDQVGHGTHVASLVAGNGAGSGGAWRGIAPAADLLNGKVLNDEGEGQLSWVIAGMEWAVAQGADIVNLSVAARPGVIDDPVVRSLDALARDTGTLFVVAAGNSGWNGWVPETVTSPGTAASALTVGAVDSHDAPPGFSGQGPTRGSYRTKPDVAAPGVAIHGARAGARDGDADQYVPQSGTSMATPLVAGAAALVMQQHPDYSWEQVKSSVTASADRIERPWATGSGRLALERTIAGTATVVPGSISPGPSLHPDESPLTTTLTVTNTGDETRTYSASDVTMSPDRGTEAPEAALVITPETVTIAAGDSATVDATIDPSQVADGYWHGYVDLTADDGSDLRLPFAAYDEPERYWLDVTVLDRRGEPYAGGSVPLQNIENGYYYTAHLDESGHARLRVAPGTYSATTIISTEEDSGPTTAVVGPTSLQVHHDVTLTIDARDAEPVRAPIIHGHQTRATEFSMVWAAAAPNGVGYGDMITPPIDDVLAGRIFVAPTVAGRPGTFEAATRWRLEPRGKRNRRTPDAFQLLFVDDALADQAPRVLTPRDVKHLAEVTEHSYAPEQGASVLQGLVSASPLTPGVVHRQQVSAPRTQTVLMTADHDVRWGYDSYWLDEGPQWLYSANLAPYEPASDVEHHLRRGLHIGIPAGGAHHADWGLFLEQRMVDGVLSGPIPFGLVQSASTTLYADGARLGSSPDTFGWFDVPLERTSYRLVGDLRLNDGRSAHGTWDFTSAPPTDPEVGATVPPILTVDYGPAVSLTDTAERDRDLRFALRIGHLPGATASERVATAQLRWSTDDGHAWQVAPLRRTGDATFVATIERRWLATGHAVSVRFTATDADGNSIDQRVADLVRLD